MSTNVSPEEKQELENKILRVIGIYSAATLVFFGLFVAMSIKLLTSSSSSDDLWLLNIGALAFAAYSARVTAQGLAMLITLR